MNNIKKLETAHVLGLKHSNQKKQKNTSHEPSLNLILTPYPKDYISHSLSSLKVAAVNML